MLELVVAIARELMLKPPHECHIAEGKNNFKYSSSRNVCWLSWWSRGQHCRPAFTRSLVQNQQSPLTDKKLTQICPSFAGGYKKYQNLSAAEDIYIYIYIKTACFEIVRNGDLNSQQLLLMRACSSILNYLNI
jgi:hypothetical protein